MCLHELQNSSNGVSVNLLLDGARAAAGVRNPGEVALAGRGRYTPAEAGPAADRMLKSSGGVKWIGCVVSMSEAS